MAEGSEVALAALALAGSMGAGVVWMAKYFAKQLSKDLQEHTKAAQQQVQASKVQAEASKTAAAASGEVLLFMRKLNGRLPKLVEEKIEQARNEE
jgi:hypothetical protein